MVNVEKFAERLNKIMDYYELSAATLADKIEVQRSSISHILSGRNKPSLDFVLKILKEFPEVELYWLLNGVGNFPKEVLKKNNIPPSAPSAKSAPNDLFTENIVSPEKLSENKVIFQKAEVNPLKEIDRIVVFYKDGTFKNYHPE